MNTPFHSISYYLLDLFIFFLLLKGLSAFEDLVAHFIFDYSIALFFKFDTSHTFCLDIYYCQRKK